MSKKEIRVCASGYFDPIHEGHIEYLRAARKLGTKLIVILDSNEQAILKKGFAARPIKTKLAILRELKCVDEVVVSIDEDRTVRRTLEMIKPDIFAKGGDAFAATCPEAEVCKRLGIRIVDGVGGVKVQSSSALVKDLEGKLESSNALVKTLEARLQSSSAPAKNLREKSTH